MTPRPPAEPRLDHVARLFRVRGANGRSLRCPVYRVETGRELRLEYEDRNDLLRSKLFRAGTINAIATLADGWHRGLVAKGFEDLPI